MTRDEPFGALGTITGAVREVRVGGAPVAAVDLDPDMSTFGPDRHLAAGAGG
jgi:hypothetical protein